MAEGSIEASLERRGCRVGGAGGSPLVVITQVCTSIIKVHASDLFILF